MKKLLSFLSLSIQLVSLVSFSQSNSTTEGIIEKQLKLSKEYKKKNIDSAFYFVNQATLLSKKAVNDTLLAKSFIEKSNLLILKGSFSSADSILNLNLNKKLPSHIIGKTWHNLASIQFYKQQYSKALDLYLKAASFIEQSQNNNKNETLANTYSNIGILNASLKDFDKAKNYLEKALALNPTEASVRLKILSNLCTFYYDTASYTKFINNIFETEELAKTQNAKRVLSIIYTNLTRYYTDVEIDYNKAIDYGEKSVVLKKELNFIQSLSFSYNNLGYTYLQKKEYKNSIKYFDSLLAIKSKQVSPIVFNNLKNAYYGLRDYKNALKYADIRDQLKDSISEQQQQAKVAELMEKFESEKKQQEINVLDTKTELQALTIKQQRYWFYGLFIVAFLASIIGFFSFKSFKTKQKLDKVLLKQKFLKAQLNPHFLFNALQSIQNFIYQNNTTKSTSYLASYSKLIRLVLENSDKDLIPISEDKLAIDSYLNLQQLAHNNTFDYSIEVEENVDLDFDNIPPLITQPFVENAVLHGVKGIEKGFITINYYKEKNTLCVSIHDNGKGFVEKSEDQKRLHKSMSLNIIKEQFKTLSQTSKNFNGEILMDLSLGTKVILKITT